MSRLPRLGFFRARAIQTFSIYLQISYCYHKCCHQKFLDVPSSMFSQSTSTKRFLSGRDCSCQKPIACIISCMMVPLWLQPLPKETSCPWLSLQYFFPTLDQHLKNFKVQKIPLSIILNFLDESTVHQSLF